MTPTAECATWREYLEALLVAGLFLGFTNTFVLKTFFIPSGSMEDTLLIGDHLIVNKYVFGAPTKGIERLLPERRPRRGDIVVFRSPEDPSIDLVKRLIGLPGDRVEMHQQQLYVNGQRVDGDGYVVHKDPRVGSAASGLEDALFRRDNFGPIVVPSGQYFFLGDNRDLSKDSRYWGTAPAHYVEGRASLIYWSYGGETDEGEWHGLTDKLRRLARTGLGFFTETRWSRTFHLPR